MGFERGHGIKYAFKRGEQTKNMVCKGGGHQKNSLKFGSDSIYGNANISARMPKKISVSKVLKIQNFPGEHASRTPTLLYTQRQLYPTNCFLTKYSQGNVNSTLFWPLLVYSPTTEQLITVSKIQSTLALRTPRYYGHAVITDKS